MVVNDLNPFWTSVAPPEADTPLIIDSNTVLPRTITAQTLESVTRRNPEVFQTARSVNLTQLAQRNAHDACIEGRNRLPLKQALSLTIPERLDHDTRVYPIPLLTQAIKPCHSYTLAFPLSHERQQQSRATPSRDPATASFTDAIARPASSYSMSRRRKPTNPITTKQHATRTNAPSAHQFGLSAITVGT